MKTITTYFFVAAFLISIGLNVVSLLASNNSEAPRGFVTQAAVVNLNNSEEPSADLRVTLEEIKVILASQEQRQIDTEEKIHDLLAATNRHQTMQEAPFDIAHSRAETDLITMAEDEFELVKTRVDDQIYSGLWTVKDAAALAQTSDHMSHEQRSNLQLKIVQAINDGLLEPENIHLPLF
ncbi:hypothetical protein [Aliikangiella coralliicola]|uniref:Uncharacterized protein n=1 Tax=Aliikangiella coralliicola TaxID=2592383 RepID=A0A545UF31_9GAMM|nr:hypothetical protein [Aliikangiella coralliicola]TQV88045.1 hypothetical protein FLL46_09560 [Aliikangiella coralliicola]